jgi:hypothetical protein
MKKAKVILTVTAGLAMTVACAPKSRYRAKDSIPMTTAKVTAKTPVTSEVSTVSKDLTKDIPATAAPADDSSKNFSASLDFIGLAQSSQDDGTLSVNLYISDKTQLHLVSLSGSKDNLKIDKVSDVGSADLLTEDRASKLSASASCLDAACDQMKLQLTNDQNTKLEISTKIENIKMVATKIGDKDLDSKIKNLLGDVNVQRALVHRSDADFYTLTVVDTEGGPYIFAIDKDKAIQSLRVLYGRKSGLEAADYSGSTSPDSFDLTLKDKDKNVLGKIHLEKAPAPAVPAPAAQPSAS